MPVGGVSAGAAGGAAPAADAAGIVTPIILFQITIQTSKQLRFLDVFLSDSMCA